MPQCGSTPKFSVLLKPSGMGPMSVLSWESAVFTFARRMILVRLSAEEMPISFATRWTTISAESAGAKPKSQPKDRMYGMRDFVIFDPDGNQLSFCCDNERD